jgi:hypothetical protein
VFPLVAGETGLRAGASVANAVLARYALPRVNKGDIVASLEK